MTVPACTIEKMENLSLEQYQYVVKLIDLFSVLPSKKKAPGKRIGAAEGKFTIADDFNSHDEEIAKMFGV